MRKILSIDPGVHGGYTVLTNTGIVEHIGDLPVILEERATKKTPKRVVNAGALAALIMKHRISVVVVERVGVMPRDGAVGAFSFGRTAGIIEGVACALGVQLEKITPQSWKKHMGLIGTGKDEARLLALRLYPELAPFLKRKKDVDRADSLLIGRTYVDRVRGLRALAPPSGHVDIFGL